MTTWIAPDFIATADYDGTSSFRGRLQLVLGCDLERYLGLVAMICVVPSTAVTLTPCTKKLNSTSPYQSRPTSRSSLKHKLERFTMGLASLCEQRQSLSRAATAIHETTIPTLHPTLPVCDVPTNDINGQSASVSMSPRSLETPCQPVNGH